MVKQRKEKMRNELQVQICQKKTENEHDRMERMSASYSNFGPGETEQEVKDRRLDSQKGTKQGLDNQIQEQKTAYSMMRASRKEQERRQVEEYQNAYNNIQLEM